MNFVRCAHCPIFDDSHFLMISEADWFAFADKFPEFSLQPNPATEILSIIASTDVGKVDIAVTNTLGEIVIRQKGSLAKDEALLVPLGDLAAGLYYIRISGMDMSRVLMFVHVK